MSKNKRLRNQTSSDLTNLGLNDRPGSSAILEISEISAIKAQPAGTLKDRMLNALRGRWWAVALVAVLSLSALGGTLKYLEQDAQRIAAERQRLGYLKKPDEFALSKLNPFVSAPLPLPTPQLSKEYIYAAQRTLVVEDANANPAIPADLAAWRPSNGYWYVMGPTNATFADLALLGMNTDIPVPGDYDGDGKTDFAIYRNDPVNPSSNYWYVIKSSDPSGASMIYQQSGTTGDVPAPGDYDGDGKTDYGAYRPSDGNFYIIENNQNFLVYNGVGSAGDIPVPAADYDGDGKADGAVFRPSNSTYYILRSTDYAQYQVQLSTTITSGQTAVPGDYDGDGRADCAMRSGNDWIIKLSASGSTQTISWYAGTDVAVQNDYDGDGKTDIAVWRGTAVGGWAAGVWYIRQSSHLGQPNELRIEVWGTTGDIPVPALWRR